jgi:hypothetical protein
MITVCHLIAALPRVADSRKEKNSLVGRANGGFLFKPIYIQQTVNGHGCCHRRGLESPLVKPSMQSSTKKALASFLVVFAPKNPVLSIPCPHCCFSPGDQIRVRRFRKKIFFASKRNEAKRDPFRLRFARSREKKNFFASFRFKFFVSDHARRN